MSSGYRDLNVRALNKCINALDGLSDKMKKITIEYLYEKYVRRRYMRKATQIKLKEIEELSEGE